jgi:hypothetical protein
LSSLEREKDGGGAALRDRRGGGREKRETLNIYIYIYIHIYLYLYLYILYLYLPILPISIYISSYISPCAVCIDYERSGVLCTCCTASVVKTGRGEGGVSERGRASSGGCNTTHRRRVKLDQRKQRHCSKEALGIEICAEMWGGEM